MSLFGQGWWVMDLVLVGLAGLLLGWMVQCLHGRKRQQAEIDAIHHRCWAEQDHWLAEHEAQMAGLERDRREAVAREQVLIEAGEQGLKAIEQVRREMDSARASHSQAEQALCQQLIALDRQAGAERTAHRREVQALRVQCDELNELLAACRTDLLAAQTRPAAEPPAPQIDPDAYQQVCHARDGLREEVTKLLDLLEQSDAAQAALQHRANALEQQMMLGQRQLEALRQALHHERTRPSPMRPVAQAAITTITSAALVANAHPARPPSPSGGHALRPFERLPDSPAPDNLQRITGIGPANQVWLNRCGVWYLWQIAGWKAEELQWVAGHLPRFGRRVYRENWVTQAKALLDEQRGERRVYPARLPPGAPDRRVNTPQPSRELAAA